MKLIKQYRENKKALYFIWNSIEDDKLLAPTPTLWPLQEGG